MLTKTIVLHYKKLKNRKYNTIQQLNKYGFLDYHFYENYDQNELSSNIIFEHYESCKQNPKKWKNKVCLWGKKALGYHNPQLNIAEISLTIKFGKVFQKLAQDTFDHCIIFEDDIILCDNFNSAFNYYLEQTPKDWDAIYFGSCVNLRSKNIEPNKFAYHKSHPASRGGCATLLKYKTIVDLSNTWFPFNLVSDWELSAQHHLHNHKIYWWEPPLIQQGSETNLFRSTLR